MINKDIYDYAFKFKILPKVIKKMCSLLLPFEPKKKLGQNFIFSEKILKRIVELIKIEKETTIIEIGTGFGNLTKFLVDDINCNKVITIEKDERIYDFIKNKLDEKIFLFNEDILKINLKKIVSTEKNIIFVGNLPYYLSKEIIVKIILEEINPKKMVFLIQEEVGEKMISQKKKNQGSLSVFLKTFCNLKKLFKVSKNFFEPKPKVNGVLLEILFENKIFFDVYEVVNLEKKKYLSFLKEIFSFRRKTLENNLINLVKKKNLEDLYTKKVKEILLKNELDLSKRPEELEIKEYVLIFKLFQENKFF